MAVLSKPENTVTQSVKKEGKAYTINANAQSFKILSDGIYPNKILAVIRELSTNGNDATIDARKVSLFHKHLKFGESLKGSNFDFSDEWKQNELKLLSVSPDYDMCKWQHKKPIVHMPNINEPFFSIRDFGTGLHPDFVETLYTEYFFSNKSTSNDYTGCMGLGSKSPFAYTDNFSVTSYWNGRKYVFSAYLKEGFPNIVPVGEFDTDEPNGLFVSLNLKNNDDIAKFHAEARKVYQFFTEVPEIVGDYKLKKELDEIVDKRQANFISCKDYFYHECSTPYAIMGNVAYPINGNGVDCKSLKNLVIRFKVGELDITPSREHLSFTKKTLENISKRIDFVISDIPNRISEYLQSCPSRFEASKFYANYIYKNNVISSKYLNDDSVTWKDEKVRPSQVFESNYNIYGFKYLGKKKEENINYVEFYKDFEIFEVDMPNGNFSRCQLYADKHNKYVYCVDFKNIQQRNEFLQEIGLPLSHKFVKTSSLPKPDKIYSKVYGKKESSGKTSSFIFEYGYKGTSSRYYRRTMDTEIQNKYWIDVTTTIDLTKGGVYVEMRANKTYINNQEIHPKHLVEIHDTLKALLGKDFTLIGVRKDMIKEFKESDDWVHINDYIESMFRMNPAVDEAMFWLDNREPVKSEFNFFSKFSEEIGIQTQCSHCEESIKLIKYKVLQNYIKWIPRFKPKDKTISEVNALICKKMPMLKAFYNAASGYNSNVIVSEEDKKTICEYIMEKKDAFLLELNS